ncbi:hypothetical protein KKG48_02665 [Patescibacteria group bacterium]|nr:hypothetical protein [Patescibacteria group bacterium]MCG2695011.1 hypothetical protein [Candidatus Parcubacteria bacterium]
MTQFLSFLKNFVFQKTKKWCHAREDGFSRGKSVDEMPKAFRLRELRSDSGEVWRSRVTSSIIDFNEFDVYKCEWLLREFNNQFFSLVFRVIPRSFCDNPRFIRLEGE